MLIRLQKHIADLGYASRRKAEVLISEGKVLVNGKRITEAGTKVDPEKDKVKIVGYAPTKSSDLVYIALNKPIDYVSSTTSSQGVSVMELLTQKNQIGRYKTPLKARVYPVGRLDKDSSGLMLLTNDGEMANKLTHPRYEHEKEYELIINQPLSNDAKKVLSRGMKLGNETVKGIKIKKQNIVGRRTVLTVILTEGKNRQIRKMFGRLGYDLVSLKRTRISKLKIGTMPVGKWRYVKKENII